MTDDDAIDLNRALMLDGNAAAGLMQELFGGEMTADPAECAGCGTVSAVGALLAFGHGPGLVLRCPACEAVMVRVARTPGGICLDARGVSLLRMPLGK